MGDKQTGDRVAKWKEADFKNNQCHYLPDGFYAV